MHARGDEQVPYTVSEELYAAAAEPKRLLMVPGGHHRSLQHDVEMQNESLRFLERARGVRPRPSICTAAAAPPESSASAQGADLVSAAAGRSGQRGKRRPVPSGRATRGGAWAGRRLRRLGPRRGLPAAGTASGRRPPAAAYIGGAACTGTMIRPGTRFVRPLPAVFTRPAVERAASGGTRRAAPADHVRDAGARARLHGAARAGARAAPAAPTGRRRRSPLPGQPLERDDRAHHGEQDDSAAATRIAVVPRLEM